MGKMYSSISFETLLNQSLDREMDGEMAVALQNAKAALAQAQFAGDMEAYAQALTRLGSIHYRLGHFENMKELAARALSQAGEESRARADALLLLGNYAFETGSLDDAEAYFQEVADLSRQIDYPLARYRALHNTAAGAYSLRGQFNLALTTYEEAYRIACQINSPQKVIPLIAMCYIHLEIGQLSQARHLIDKIALQAAPDSFFYGYYLMLKGKLAEYEGDPSSGLSNYLQAEAVTERIGDVTLHIFLSLGKSHCHRMLGNIAYALEWANDAVEWANRANNRRMTGRALAERGYVEWLAGRLEDSEKDLRNAVNDLTERQQQFDLTLAQFYLAALLFARQNPLAEQV